MEWIQFIILMVTIAGLFFWNRTESRADYRHMEARNDAREARTAAILDAIKDEIKDFHGRLCAIEEKRKS